MSDEGYYALAQAIILQAVKDFRPAYLRLKRCPDDKAATARVKEITEFFCSEYFCLLTDVDGPRLLKKIMKQIDEGGDAP
ncbi:MAG: hypothetical protein IJL96_11175 [Clostridia bacterium]|nr:hypothetical protein [Clostridia bacterium]